MNGFFQLGICFYRIQSILVYMVLSIWVLSIVGFCYDIYLFRSLVCHFFIWVFGILLII